MTSVCPPLLLPKGKLRPREGPNHKTNEWQSPAPRPAPMTPPGASGSKARRPPSLAARRGCPRRPPAGPPRPQRAPAHLAQQVERVAGARGPLGGVHARRQRSEAAGQRRVLLGGAAAEGRVLRAEAQRLRRPEGRPEVQALRVRRRPERPQRQQGQQRPGPGPPARHAAAAAPLRPGPARPVEEEAGGGHPGPARPGSRRPRPERPLRAAPQPPGAPAAAGKGPRGGGSALRGGHPWSGDAPAGLKEEGRGAEPGTRRQLCSRCSSGPSLLHREPVLIQ